MKDILRIFLFGLMVTILSTGCDVHEFPRDEEEPPIPPTPVACTLNLLLEDEGFDFHDNIVVNDDNRSRAGRSSRADAEHDLRYIVRAYRYDANMPQIGSRVSSRYTIDYCTVTVPDTPENQTLSVPLTLDPGEYEIVAWTDHVLAGTVDDYYHNTADFMEIRLLGAGEDDYEHSGNNNNRVAWRGMTHIVVNELGEVAMYDNPGRIVTDVNIDMERPMARYHFISNDLAKFIESEVSRMTQAGEQDPNGIDTPDMTAPNTPNVDDYVVIMRYTGYMPCAYNTFSDKPMDSATGVSYEGKISVIDENHAELAFDHVLVNHNQTSVQVALDLYRRSDGQRLSSTGTIDVPLKRGKYTTVTGPMLTTSAGAAMGINPDFNGEFNIEIQ